MVQGASRDRRAKLILSGWRLPVFCSDMLLLYHYRSRHGCQHHLGNHPRELCGKEAMLTAVCPTTQHRIEQRRLGLQSSVADDQWLYRQL